MGLDEKTVEGEGRYASFVNAAWKLQVATKRGRMPRSCRMEMRWQHIGTTVQRIGDEIGRCAAKLEWCVTGTQKCGFGSWVEEWRWSLVEESTEVNIAIIRQLMRWEWYLPVGDTDSHPR